MFNFRSVFPFGVSNEVSSRCLDVFTYDINVVPFRALGVCFRSCEKRVNDCQQENSECFFHSFADLKFSAATSGVRSRCGVASISYPTKCLRIVADRSSGGKM